MKVLAGIIAVSAAAACAQSDFIADGEFGGKAGTAFNYIEYNDDTKDSGLAWAYAEAGVKSGEWKGLVFGTYWMFPGTYWETPDDYGDRIFDNDYVIRDLYMDWTPEGTKTTLTVGRKKFVKTPVMDGDAHEGVQIVSKDLERVEFSASIIRRWINNCTMFLDSDGVSDREDADDAVEGAGDLFYTAMAKVNVWEDRLVISPFFNWQDDVMGAAGSGWDYTHPLNDGWSLGLDGNVNCFINGYDEDDYPDYGDVWMSRIHAALKHEAGFVGAGYYVFSNDDLNTTAGMFDRNPPLEELDLVPGNENDAEMVYFDAEYRAGKMKCAVKYGIGTSHSADTDFQELNLFLFYDLTGSLELGSYFVHTDYSTGVKSDYNRAGFSVVYSF